MSDNLLTLKQASKWASDYIGRNVTPSNISYLIQYGRIPKIQQGNNLAVNQMDLEEYYKTHTYSREQIWKEKLGKDLNWKLSFSEYKEAETTKHVHRLHPYKGKFIPQLVEYFLDDKTDEFKKEVFFQKGDLVLDPFCGSGTTLVQANELGMNAIGIDVSEFNSFISNVKLDKYDLHSIQECADRIVNQLKVFQRNRNNDSFENQLLSELKIFNDKYFPTPEFKYQVRHRLIDEKSYSQEKEQSFLKVYQTLVNKYGIPLRQKDNNTFLAKWFLQVVRDEIDFVFEQIQGIDSVQIKKILGLVLSRTIRSCRATTHADLATLKEPVIQTYYCHKHGKICKPLFSILSWWQRYSKDTIDRLKIFDALRTDTQQICLNGDSRNIDILQALSSKQHPLSKTLQQKKIAGIFSSPPYVGLIDYHEQHAYSYELFGYQRNDGLEIGPLYKGQGMAARKSYVEGIVQVLHNSKKYLKNDFNVFLVANDKYNLYPTIAEESGMRIVNRYKRPVLNRTEKDKGAYAEIIFHLKER